MPLILQIIVAGLIATLAMTPFFRIFKAMGTNAPSLIEVVGTLFTSQDRRSLPWGIVLHFTLGVAWAFIYFAAIRLFGSPEPAAIMAICIGMSFFQALIVTFNIANMVAEHPNHREFRVQSPAVAVTYLVTHVIYGATLGFMFGMFQVVPV